MNAPLEPYILEIRKVISEAYLCSLMRVAQILGLENDLALSDRELKLALEEAEIDVRALLMRRSEEDGISEGKIAGVYAFRLSRFKIVHAVTMKALKHPDLSMVQDIVALNVVKRRILKVKMGAERMRELAYQMARRHANQETLGLALDSIHQAAKGSPTRIAIRRQHKQARIKSGPKWAFWNLLR